MDQTGQTDSADDVVSADELDSANDLVRVASCWDVARADLAQLVLAEAGVTSALESAAFLSWFWHYGIAVGGVKVHVRRCQSEDARRVLAEARTRPTESLPPRTCPHCAQRLAAQWEVCWQCGLGPDETPGDQAAEDTQPRPQGEPDTERGLGGTGLCALPLVVMLLAQLWRYGLVPFLVNVPVVVFYGLLLNLLGRVPDERPEEPGPDATAERGPAAGPPEPPSSGRSGTQSRVGRAIVLRGWQAAVLGAFMFPPLGVYSLRLLCKRSLRNIPLGRADKLRYAMSFFLGGLAAVLCVFAVVVLSMALAETLAFAWFRAATAILDELAWFVFWNT